MVVVPMEYGRELYRKGEPNHHLHTWNPLLLGTTFEVAGFDVVSSRTIGVYHKCKDQVFTVGMLPNASYDVRKTVLSKVRAALKVVGLPPIGRLNKRFGRCRRPSPEICPHF